MLNNIQVLRAFAAIIVVIFHIAIAGESYKIPSEILGLTGSFGRSGVDIFFVISGFIMVYTQHNKSTSPVKFIKDRVIRIVPIYWFYSVLLLMLYLLIPSAFREFEPNKSFILSSFLFSSEWVFSKHPLLYVGWTLEYEMLFYVVFSISLVFSELKYRFIIPVLFILLLPLLKNIDFIIYEFLFGMLVAKLYLSGFLKSQGFLVFGFGLALLYVFLLLPYELHRVLLFGLPAFFIVLSVLYLPIIKNKLLLHLGNASYSIYLIQVFTIPTSYKFGTMYLTFLDANVIAILALLVTLVGGSLSYICVERPITKFLKKY
ncbi:acyltransferase [Acinetobacter sp. YH12052]|uniref:acyltransferase family protein n=1 Tax=Acinetobacter sp. YH12052 TaxID=2601055 RepID=UPI0015D3AB83|nr:acyltransferase [Acinetobacter sp. YH12052]